MPDGPIDLSKITTDATATERIAAHLEGETYATEPVWGEKFAAAGPPKGPSPSPPPVPAPAK